MPDITMCHGTNCEVKTKCYRFTATPSENWQSYFEGIPSDSGCDYFLPVKEEKKDLIKKYKKDLKND